MRRLLLILLLLSSVLSLPSPAFAQPAPSFIRDAEIEAYLRALEKPILQAAGIPPDSVDFAIVQDDNLNAFVAGGMHIYVYTGLLQQSESPLQLIGVLAHETGHIAGGHLVRGTKVMEQASAEAILATVIGVAAGIASGNAGAGQAIIGGGQNVAARNFLAFSRVQESSADAAGMSFLDKAGLSSQGLLQFMEKLADQELLPTDRQVEFVRTHPLTQDRIDNLRAHVESSAFSNAPAPPAWVEQHARMRAKLDGFLDPLAALQKYPATDTSFAGRYARAIALFKRNQLAAALPIVDALLKEEPTNAYLYELKGQMLFENSRVEEAVTQYRQAAALAPDAALIRTAYAHALIESGQRNMLDTAVDELQQSLDREPHAPFTWHLLATAWGQQGLDGQAAYALAEEAAGNGDIKGAKAQVARAENMLPNGNPYRLKLLDLKASLKRADDHS